MKRGDLIRISNGSELIRVESYAGAFFLEERPATLGFVKYHAAPLIGIYLGEKSIQVPPGEGFMADCSPPRTYYEFALPFGHGWIDSSLLWFELLEVSCRRN